MGLFEVFKKKAPAPENTAPQKPAAPAYTVEDVKAIVDEIGATTTIPVVDIKLTHTSPALCESKFGGVAYVPHDGEIPVGSQGNQMKLLAQIDCTQLVGLEDFPHSGLLQFWAANDDVYGMDFDDQASSNDSRVIYFEQVDSTVTREEVEGKIKPCEEEDYFPVNGEFGMKFELTTQAMPTYNDGFDERFSAVFNAKFPNENIESFYDLDEEIYDKLTDDDDTHHQMAGYPYFTQSDPREYTEKFKRFDTLLMQIDSDYDKDTQKDVIIWGDCGVCNFFINREDLKNCDFSKVLYNWDCC